MGQVLRPLFYIQKDKHWLAATSASEPHCPVLQSSSPLYLRCLPDEKLQMPLKTCFLPLIVPEITWGGHGL